jgi:hypothetical protein
LLLPSAVNVSRIKPFKDRNQELVFDRFLTTVNYSNQDTAKGFALTDGDEGNSARNFSQTKK